MSAPRTTAVAERMGRLGTETAFAVSAEANEWRSLGHTVYPFHLGDMDLPTPENIVEAAFRAIRDGKTGYCPNAGIPELREALAADVGASHGVAYGPENVAVQPGGKPVIEKFLLTLMDPGDEVLYPSPGFPIYESQIEFLGGVGKPYGFVPGERNFLLDFEAIEAAITPRTRLLIFNNLHNPTGAESPDEEIEALAELAVKHDLFVLSDEAYWDVRYSGREHVDRVAAGHAGAHRHPLHVQQEVRHDGVAPGRRDRAEGAHRAHRHAQRQPGVVHHALHPVGGRRGAHGRPVGRGADPAHPEGAPGRRGRAARRDPRRHLLPPRGDVLPVPQRHRA